MHISIAASAPSDPAESSLTLTQTYRPTELVFALLVFLPGPLLWLYVADTLLWGILSTLVFAYLAIGFLPPSSSLRIHSATGTMCFTRQDSLLSAPHHFEANTKDVAHVELRNVWVKEISKKITGVQLLVVFNEGFGIPTSDTLAHGAKTIAQLKDAAQVLANALHVDLVDDTHLDPRKLEEEKQKLAAEMERKHNQAEELDEDDYADVAQIDSDPSSTTTAAATAVPRKRRT